MYVPTLKEVPSPEALLSKKLPPRIITLSFPPTFPNKRKIWFFSHFIDNF